MFYYMQSHRLNKVGFLNFFYGNLQSQCELHILGSLWAVFKQSEGFGAVFKQFEAVIIIAFIKTANVLLREHLRICVSSSVLNNLSSPTSSYIYIYIVFKTVIT